MIEGILFDMDGVLVDSEKYICEAAIKMFEEKGHKVRPEDFLPFVGAGENRYLGGVAEKHNIPINLDQDKKRTYEIYDEIVSGRLEPLPGVREFIDRCNYRGIKTALATSADKTKMLINLREIKLPPDTFDAVINGLDVERKKPFPDIYLEAAKRIGKDIKKCLVVEDAVNGVEAAKSAGAKCLALTTGFSREELSGADMIISDLSEVNDETFEKIISM